MDEDDLKWVTNEKYTVIFVLKQQCFTKLSHSSEMQNDALIVHCEVLEG